MCPWIAWSGQPILIEELLFRTKRGLIDVARTSSTRDAEVAIGVGWYEAGHPKGYHSSRAEDDRILRDLAGRVEASVFLAHGGAGDKRLPLVLGDWLFVASGALVEPAALRPEVVAATAPTLALDGVDDAELLFAAFRAYAAAAEPPLALEHAIACVEELSRRSGAEPTIRATVGLTDGRTVWAMRYASRGSAPTLFGSGDVQSLRMLYPENARVQRLREGDRIIVSDPFASLAGAWNPVPEGTIVTISDGRSERRLFRPELAPWPAGALAIRSTAGAPLQAG